MERTLRKGIGARATRFVLGSCVPAGRERLRNLQHALRAKVLAQFSLCRIAAETRVGVSLSAARSDGMPDLRRIACRGLASTSLLQLMWASSGV